MLDRDTHRLLTLFGDAKPHSFFEITTLGNILLKASDRKIERIFKRALLDNGWVRRCGKSWAEHLDSYELTSKGDEFFRRLQISRIKRGKYSDDTVRHFQQFNRKATGKYGAEGMGENLTEEAAGLKEKYPHLYE